MDKNDPKRLYYWLFTEDNKAPLGFIPTFLMILIIAITIGAFVIPIIHSFM